ncbi:hypothetical protein U9M48_042481 [Paspalum notatum var. saurae]|uniref:Uncharacterized protein n=1 Tax=Paspalum notatum var. saurae TaxID=547442 RepID=A0AAQ3URI6_PASNO
MSRTEFDAARPSPGGLVPTRHFVASLPGPPPFDDPATPVMDALIRLHRSLVGGEEDQPDDSILAGTEGLCSFSPPSSGETEPLRNPECSNDLFRDSGLHLSDPVFVVCLVQRIYAFVRRMLGGRTGADDLALNCHHAANSKLVKIHDKLLTLIAIICEICTLFWIIDNCSDF